MKEYKVVSLPVKWNAFSSKDQNEHLGNFLNDFGRDGWRVIHTSPEMHRYILERDKNR